MNPGRKNNCWKKEEDEKLKRTVSEIGTENWNEVAKYIDNRNGKQCRERWLNHLNPNIRVLPFSNLKKNKWTKEEERIIKDLQGKVGNKWSLISKSITGRTANSIKNFWHSNLKKNTNVHFHEYVYNDKIKKPNKVEINTQYKEKIEIKNLLN